MSRQIYRVLLISILLHSCFAVHSSESGGKLELVEHMKQLQYFAHKLQLSVEADNKKLAAFYAHELEEVIEKVESVPSYDGHPIGEMTKTILLPAFEELEQSIKTQPRDALLKSFDKLVDSCNKCHSLTRHEYIVIKKNSSNPYMQSFKK
jgi:nitrate reductase beta subunit